MNTHQPKQAELLDAEQLTTGHCVVKLLIRNCSKVSDGDTLNVVPFITETDDEGAD